MKRRKLTFIRVWWTNGCVDDVRPDLFKAYMAYKDMSKSVSTTRKIRRLVKS